MLIGFGWYGYKLAQHQRKTGIQRIVKDITNIEEV